MEKRRNCSLGAISSLFHNIFFYLLLDVYVLAGIRFSLRDKRFFEISAVEITRVNCMKIVLGLSKRCLNSAAVEYEIIRKRPFWPGKNSLKQRCGLIVK